MRRAEGPGAARQYLTRPPRAHGPPLPGATQLRLLPVGRTHQFELQAGEASVVQRWSQACTLAEDACIPSGLLNQLLSESEAAEAARCASCAAGLCCAVPV